MTTAGTDTPHWVKNTQETLGAIIRSPKLAEKLLLKPPVKFVHDILTSFLKATGFPEGLYSAGELDSSNLKDRESKLRFIQKLIDVVASALDREVTCRAAKVISGSEPEKTNELLQWLVECHTLPKEKQINAVTEVLRRDTDGAIAAVTARMGAPSGSGGRPDPPSLSTQGSEIPVPITESTPSAGMSGGPESLSGSLSPKLKESNLNTLDAADIKLETHSSPPSISERPNSSAVRLRTQQPRPSEPRAGKDTGKSSSLAESNPSIASDTYAEGEESTSPMEGKESAVDRAYRLLSRKGSTTSGTVSASGGGEEAINKGTGHGEGEPQGYFAREALQERESGEGRTGDDRNDTAGLRTGSAAGGEPRRKENGIILRTSEKKRVVGSKGTGLDNNNSDASGSQGSNHRSGLGSSGQIARGNATASEPTAGNSAPDRAQELQEKLRVLSKATHPIGVVVENNAADIEAILRELTQWKTEYRVQAQRLIEVRREHEEQLRPLEIQLKDLRATTLEQEHMVNSMRAVVCANERAIEQLIHMMTGTGE